MGGAAGIGLGLALARPDLAVIVVDGDSSLLMELGGLVTVAHNKPARLIHFVVNNGVQFNGLVNLPRAGTSPNCDFAAMAKAAGYSRSQKINDLMVLTSVLQDLLVAEGASFIELVIEADPAFVGQSNPQPLLPDLQFQRMRAAVGRLKSELEAC
jgi:phosphonopyruvate decarboxylase